MKRRAWAGNTAGYTILEVMIVLTVTGALFASTVALLGGKQAQSEATQSVRRLESELQLVASEVANGYYQNGFTCLPTANSVTVSPGNAGPGENVGCVFLGKIISLKASSAEIITVVGRQYTALPLNSTNDVQDLTEAAPIVVAQNNVNITQTYNYLYNLTITKAVSIADTTKEYKALGYMLELGGGGSTGSTSSSSRSLLLYGIPGTASGNNTQDKDINPTALETIPGGLRLCFITGNGNKAEIEIGKSGNQTSTSVLVADGVGSDC